MPNKFIPVNTPTITTGDAKEVYKVLRSPNGAVYVCGDAKHMSRDVNRALLQVLQREGEYAIHEAEEIIRRLVVDKRYMKDVW